MLILDTNTVSYYLRGDDAVVNRLHAISPSDVGIPAIVEYELRFGFERLPVSARTKSMNRLIDVLQALQALQVLPFDSDCAQYAARIRAALEAIGSPIGPHDILIAATALRYGGTLVTRNSREFSRVAGLQWQNWHEQRQSDVVLETRALRKAGDVLDKVIEAKGVDVESVMSEFNAVRKRKNTTAKTSKKSK